MKFKLKQPTKYTHESLENQKEQSEQDSQNDHNGNSQAQNQGNHDSDIKKKKIIQKQHTHDKKKTINKKDQPSALRLQKINDTFDNLYQNGPKMFADLQIDTQKLNVLIQQTQKSKCLCQKNVKYYCLKCMTKCTKLDFPKIQLPVHLNIIHHQSQKLNKSSALPLKFLTDQASLHYFSSSQLSQKTNQKLWFQLQQPSENTYILFPHKDSELVTTQNVQKIQNLMILDCTWFQTDQLLEALAKKGYKNYLRIQNCKSVYWRYNHHSDSALSSAQAVTFFMKDYQKALNQLTSNQQKNQIQRNQKKYDNLLFLYCLNMKLVLRQEQNRRNGPKTVEQKK